MSSGIARTFFQSAVSSGGRAASLRHHKKARYGSRAAALISAGRFSPTVATQSAGASKSQQTVIDAGDYFNPVQLTVSSGTTLTWRNVGGESHKVIARDGSFSSSSLMAGERFTFKLTKPGQYADDETARAQQRPARRRAADANPFNCASLLSERAAR